MTRSAFSFFSFCRLQTWSNKQIGFSDIRGTMLSLFNNFRSDTGVDSDSKHNKSSGNGIGNGNATNGHIIDNETVYRKYYRTHRFGQLTQKCPDFIRSCSMCMCLYRKVEPGDPNGNGSNSNNLNGTPIIPITAGPDAYVFILVLLILFTEKCHAFDQFRCVVGGVSASRCFSYVI